MNFDSFDYTHKLYCLILKAENMLRSCFESGKKDQLYYQYTKMKSLEAMLSSGCLWATNTKYLNDYLEYQLGIDLVYNLFSSRRDKLSKEICQDLLEYRKEYENDVFSTFSVSFCEEGDLLSQWITYAKEGGISIGFDFSDDSLYWGQKIDKSFYKTNLMKDPMKLMYVSRDPSAKLRSDYKKKIITLMKEIKTAHQKQGVVKTDVEKLAFYMVLGFIKNIHFVQEKEHRIVTVPCFNNLSYDKDEKKYLSEIKTVLQDSHVFRPYIELYPVDRNSTPKKLPISELIVGPASNQKNIFRSLIYKLEHSYVEDIKIAVPKPKKLKERKLRFKAIVDEMKKKNMTETEINDKIYFCEKWGLIIKTSESSYIF